MRVGRGSLVGAVVLFLAGCLFLLVELQSPSLVLWTGARVTGYSQGGVTFYRYHGTQYTVDNPSQPASDQRKLPTTVFVDRNDPTNARLDSLTRWLDAGLVCVWFVGAALVLALGFVRQRRRGRERAGQAGTGPPGRLRAIR